MERYICIHGHFYQPPRENPWLETIEAQESAYPFHDWNERITAECYAPNGAARILDGAGKITGIVNNYSKISYNFGPTVLSWMKDYSRDVYKNILEADKQSAERFSGHGSAMAQAYNHIILPLAHPRDKETQIVWGIRDFESRYGRKPEGMWLAETAVDLESLDLMAQHGIKFTVLAPNQAAKVKPLKGGRWKDVSGGRVDPSRAYECHLPSGRTIALFFYDGPISQAVAFEKLLNSGENFAARLLSGFSDKRDWPQLMHIATDGESYGHHHPHGDMALAYALRHIEETGAAKLTNYGEYLEKHPPQMEAQIFERTAWSCSHGVERWNSNCGCRAADNGWNQDWRGPLRRALDFLRDVVAGLYEQGAEGLLNDPWAARNDYINVILNRDDATRYAFFERNAAKKLSDDDVIKTFKLLEMQRYSMLMYTSCGWFFDELSGLETVKVIEYAGRVVQLAQDIFAGDEAAAGLEGAFLQRLAEAKSNIPEHGNGADIYLRWVKPAMVNLHDVAAHYAISSLFERNSEEVPIYCYQVEREDFQTIESGKARLGIGRANVMSQTTREHEVVTFAAVHLGDHNVIAGVRKFVSDDSFAQLISEAGAAFSRADIPETLRVLDRHFGATTYTLRSLFGDQRKKIVELLLGSTLREAESTYRQIFDHHAPLMRFLSSFNMEKPRILTITAEFVLNSNLQREIGRKDWDIERISTLLEQAQAEGVQLNKPGLAYTMQKSLAHMMNELCDNPENLDLMAGVTTAVELARGMGLPVNLWSAQNLYYEMAQKEGHALRENQQEWLEAFSKLGEQLNVNTDALNLGAFELQQAS